MEFAPSESSGAQVLNLPSFLTYLSSSVNYPEFCLVGAGGDGFLLMLGCVGRSLFS